MSGGMRRVRRETITATIDEERGVFMISVAAELAHMQPIRACTKARLKNRSARRRKHAHSQNSSGCGGSSG